MTESSRPLEKNTPSENKQPAASMECGAAIGRGEMQQFVEAFQQSARRWEFVVYPALFAFIVLAGYGFFMVYSLTADMRLIARSIDPKMHEHMASMTQNMSSLTDQVGRMTSTMHSISNKLDNLEPMEDNTAEMESSMRNMEHSLRVITATTDQMRMDMRSMNHNISRPMSMFQYAPW